MTKSSEFMNETHGATTEQVRATIAAYGADTYPNQLAPVGTSLIVCFSDHSSVIVNGLDATMPQVLRRS